MPHTHPPSPTPAPGERLAAALAGVLFVALRLVGFLKDNELEDQDSIGFLERAELFRSLDLGGIVDMEATALPLYSLLTAMVSPFAADLESAARLVSLAASIATAAAAWLLAVRFAGRRAGIVAVLLLALNPYLIRFSYSVVSETLYCAIFAWTLYYFVAQLRSPSTRSALILGLLGGLAFATRFESILLFACLPLLQGAYALVARANIDRGGLLKAGLVYACTFAVLLAPQVWRVSEKMNTFGLNGRTVWQAALNSPGDGTYHERLFGLDYDPGTTNVYYLQTHPEEVAALTAGRSIFDTLRSYSVRAIVNLEALHLRQMALLVGLPILAFSVIGFLAMLRSARAADGIVALAILGLGLVAPLTNQVVLDHIALLAGPLTAFAAAGIADTLRSLPAGLTRSPVHRSAALALLVVLAAAPWALDLHRLYSKPDDANYWYEASAIAKPVAFIREAGGDGTAPSVIGAHGYVAHFAGATRVRAPWTDLAGLVEYMRLNDVDFLYVNDELKDYPFGDMIGSGEWNRFFELRFTAENELEGEQRIYSLKNPM